MNAQQLVGSQQEVATKNLGLQNDALDSLSTMNGGAGPKFADVQQKLQQGLSQGWLQPHNAQSVLTGMPTGDDPQSMATRQHILQTLGQQISAPQQRLENALGSPGTMANGQVVQPGMVGGRLGQNPGAFSPSGAGVQQYPSRTDLLTQQTGVNPDGTLVVRPLASQAGLQGRPDLTGPAGQPPGAGTGLYPAPASPPAPLPGGGVPTGLSPQQTAANAADQAQYRTELGAVPTGQTNIQNLQKAQHALELITTGRGTGTLNSMKALVTSVASGFGTAPPLMIGSDNEQYDTAHKYLLDYARKSGSAGGSDAQLQAALGANAGTDINEQAALGVVKTNIGRERQKIAQVQSFADPTGAGYGQAASQFSSGTDPRAFAWDAYTPAERQKIVGGLDKPGLAKLDRSLAVAARLKLIQVPGQ